MLQRSTARGRRSARACSPEASGVAAARVGELGQLCGAVDAVELPTTAQLDAEQPAWRCRCPQCRRLRVLVASSTK
jgi:hypothetical protein